jgi:metallo-beta-lactamase class B
MTRGRNPILFISARLVVMIALAGCTNVTRAVPVSEARTQGTALATSCKDRHGWSDAAPPARIFGNTYYVGTCGISVLLVTSRKGHVLIDGATAKAAPSILANIRALGFKPREIRFIVGSHEHLDHMGGFAALKAATGAKLLVSAAARPMVETGKTDADDPQFGIILDMQPVPVDGILTFHPDPDDIITGEPTRVLSLTPHFTPGHTSGGTSWTWQSCEGGKCVNFAYVDSMSAVSADGYRFADHPERVAPFRTTFDRVAALKCDILITPHPGVSNVFERLSGKEPLIDGEACRRLVTAMRKRLDDRLAKERGQ